MQSNELAFAQYDYSLLERRLVLSAIANLDTDGPELRARVWIRDFISVFGASTASYARLKTAAGRLMKKGFIQIERPGSQEWEMFHFIVHARRRNTEAGGSYIEFQFAEQVRPFLVDLKSRFNFFTLRDIARLTSIYSLRMYEILLHDSFGGRRPRFIIDLDVLRFRLALDTYADGKRELVERGRYQEFRDFRRRVLEVAQRECNALTNLHFEYKRVTDGQAVRALEFHVTVKNRHYAADLPLTTEELNAAKDLREMGFKGDAEGVIKEHGAETVKRALKMADEIIRSAANTPNPIRNPGGLINRLLSSGAARTTDDERKTERRSVDPKSVAVSLVDAFSSARHEHALRVWETLHDDDREAIHVQMRIELADFQRRLLDREGWQGPAYLALRARALAEEHADAFPPELRDFTTWVQHNKLLDDYDETTSEKIISAAITLDS